MKEYIVVRRQGEHLYVVNTNFERPWHAPLVVTFQDAVALKDKMSNNHPDKEYLVMKVEIVYHA